MLLSLLLLFLSPVVAVVIVLFADAVAALAVVLVITVNGAAVAAVVVAVAATRVHPYVAELQSPKGVPAPVLQPVRVGGESSCSSSSVFPLTDGEGILPAPPQWGGCYASDYDAKHDVI